MTIYDKLITMYDREGCEPVFATVDKLEAMLKQYGIKHAFIYPHPQTIKENNEATLQLCYNEEDDMTVCLIYTLFSKVHRKANDEKIAGCLIKTASRYIEAK